MKKARVFFLTLAALLPPAFSKADNLFYNGDFEESNNEWASPVSGPAGSVRPRIAEGVSRDVRGRRSLCFPLEKNQTFFLKTPYVYWPFVKGIPFPSEWRSASLSLAAKADRVPLEAEGTLIFRVTLCGGEKEEITHDLVVKPEQITAEWKDFSVSFPIPEGYPEARFEVFGPRFRAPAVVYLDDFFFGDVKNGKTLPEPSEGK